MLRNKPLFFYVFFQLRSVGTQTVAALLWLVSPPASNNLVCTFAISLTLLSVFI